MDDVVTKDDREDIRASLRGDEDAYARLLARYENDVAAQMWRFTRNPQVHEELVHDVFVQAYLSLGGFRGAAPFLHWLRRIATRVGYAHWKLESRARDRQAAAKAEFASAPQSLETATPSEAGEYVYRVLAQLPPKERLVLNLLYFEDCSTLEIAERTGWSRSLVKVRAYRARQKLKRLLEEAGIGSANHG